MTDQDHVNERCCCLIIKGGVLTGKTLAIGMRLFLRGGRRVHKIATTRKGKQTVKQLSKDGAKLENIEIKDENIKSFESIARKYGIDFAAKKDMSETPPKYLVFFKSRDVACMDAAFDEYSAKHLGKSRQKPPLKQTLQQMQEKVKDQVLEQAKHKERGLEL